MNGASPGRPFSIQRAWIALLVLAAVLVRGAIPAGWMPNMAGDARAPLIICTASGPEALQLHGKDHPGHSGRAQHHEVCAFAGLGSAPSPTAADYTPPAAVAVAWTAAPAPNAAPSSRRLHREQAARAPPILV